MGRLERLQARLSELGFEAVAITDMANVAWLTGFTGSYGAAVVTPEHAVFVTDGRYAIQGAEQVQNMETRAFVTPSTLQGAVVEAAKGFGAQRVVFEAGNMTVASLARFQSQDESLVWVAEEDPVSPLRAIKDAAEIQAIREACGLTDVVFEHVCRLIQPGVAEKDIELDLKYAIERQGAGLAFPPIVVSGPNSARPHGKATERKLEVGDFVTMDFGATVRGYCSDLTRTVVVGAASDRTREVYERVLAAQVLALEMIRPGEPAKNVDLAVREKLGDLAPYFTHGLGHGLGRVVHDVGRMASVSDWVFEPGQVWTVEPGVYIEGFGGVRIEDDVVVTETGIEVLTHAPKELLILPQ